MSRRLRHRIGRRAYRKSLVAYAFIEWTRRWMPYALRVEADGGLLWRPTRRIPPAP
jgi:hypothetical protein